MLNAKNKSGMHNIAQNYTQVKNTITKKNSEYIFLNKKKNIQQIHIFHFFWRRGVFCIIKRKKIKSQPDKNNKKNAINFHV